MQQRGLWIARALTLGIAVTAASALVKERFLLPADAARVIAGAEQHDLGF